MKFKLTDQEKQKVEVSAVQQVIQSKFTEAVIARTEEIEKDLSELTTELSAEDIFNLYLKGNSVLTPAVGILVPKH